MNSRAVFFFIIISIYILMNVYVCVRGLQALPGGNFFKIIFLLIFLFFFTSLVISIPLENCLPFRISSFLQTAGNSWFLILFYSVLFVLFFDILRLADHFLHFFPKIVIEHWQTAKLAALIGTLCIISVVCTAGYIHFSHPMIKEITISTAKVSVQKELTIVAVSDLHLGFTIKKKRLQSYVEKINSLHPDLVLIAGDLFDRNIRPVMYQKMDEELRQIDTKYGVYAVYGNHEYYGRIASSKDQEVIDFLNSTHIYFLKDTAADIENQLYVVGRDDMTNKQRKPLKTLVQNLDKNKPVILLDHQPFHLEEAEKNEIDLQISGHTHAGQVFPFNYIVSRMYELGYGYKIKGKTHYYVSTGLGLWGPPFRIGTSSEIVKIQLQFNK